jgi:ABC-2 type transport system ATP-binding protein
MVEVTGLSRYYGDFAALDDVSFTIAEGEIVGLLGLNGAGKSTALKILAGLLTPSSGSVRIGGQDALTTPQRLRGRIGFLPEEIPLYRDMTVSAFLCHAGQLKGMTSAAVRARLPRVIQMTDLQGREDQVISTLSYGYRKRVGIATAVIHDPRLVVLDEPISGLDPAQIVEMRQVVRNLAAGRAVIISSHILGEISQTCDRILVVDQGRLIAQGTEEELAPERGRRLLLTVRGQRDELQAFLDGQAGIEACELQDEEPGCVQARLTLTADTREALVVALTTAGFGLRSLVEPEDELESIFLKLTSQEAA